MAWWRLWTWAAAVAMGALVVFAAAPVVVEEKLLVDMTLVPDAASTGAVCLDGSPPAYHLHPGSGSGARGWVLQIEGRWCNDARSCAQRARTSLGSSSLMNKLDVFSGLLSNDPSMNPDFYSWNRVKLRYCDGGSFAGDSEFTSGSSVIYMRGQRIWDAIITDLFRKGLVKAEKGAQKNVNKDCLNPTINPYQMRALHSYGYPPLRGLNCPFHTAILLTMHILGTLSAQFFFPQYALQSIRAPYFILNSAYDVYQFYQIFVPSSSDPRGQWSRCKADLSACSASQIATLQGLRNAMLAALKPFEGKSKVGMFINSCFAHCQSESQDTWFARDSPRLHNEVLVFIYSYVVCGIGGVCTTIFSFRQLQSWLVIGTLKGLPPKKLTAHILVTQLVTTSYHLVRLVS